MNEWLSNEDTMKTMAVKKRERSKKRTCDRPILPNLWVS